MNKLSNAERIIALFSGLVTVITFLLSIPKITINIPSLEFFANTSTQFNEISKPLKIVAFIIADCLNALFFSYLFKFLAQFKVTPILLFFYILLLTLSTYLSILFINSLFFPQHIITGQNNGLYFILVFGSWLISSIFLLTAVYEDELEDGTSGMDYGCTTSIMLGIIYIILAILNS